MTLLISTLALLAMEAAPPAALPADARLEPVRDRVQRLVDGAAAEGLPAEVIVIKVREGLAKGADPERIHVAAGRLTDSLRSAKKFLAGRRPGAASPGLMRAVAEAQLAGVALDDVDGLVARERAEGPAQRAVEVLTDLQVRGYPAGRVASVVRDVLVRDAGAVDRVPSTLESIRREYALSQAEAVESLSRGLAGAPNLQAAHARAADEEQRRGSGGGRGGGKKASAAEPGDAPGKSGVAPGRLKPKPGKPPKVR